MIFSEGLLIVSAVVVVYIVAGRWSIEIKFRALVRSHRPSRNRLMFLARYFNNFVASLRNLVHGWLVDPDCGIIGGREIHNVGCVDHGGVGCAGASAIPKKRSVSFKIHHIRYNLSSLLQKSEHFKL